MAVPARDKSGARRENAGIQGRGNIGFVWGNCSRKALKRGGLTGKRNGGSCAQRIGVAPRVRTPRKYQS